VDIRLGKPLAVGLVACALLTSKSAQASGGPMIELEAGLKGGVGTPLNDFGGGAGNPKGGPLGAGIGTRAGMRVAELYLGLSALYYFGTDQYSAPTTLSAHSFVYGIEGGWGLYFLDNQLVLRPQLGLGCQTTSSAAETPGLATVQSTKTYFYLEPGVAALYLLDTYYVGADVNAYLLPYVPRTGAECTQTSSFATAFTLHGQVGVRW
jgi:hypothetical protein